MLRLAFGGSPNPPAWCAISEMITDLANKIALLPDWNPKQDYSDDVPPPCSPITLNDDIPIEAASPMSFHIPTSSMSRADCFIDDIVNVFVDTPQNREREPYKVPLTIHATARPHAHEEEPIKRKPNVSAVKYVAEGTPVEIQVVLGWTIDTRRLLVGLPDDKYKAWTCDVSRTIETKSITIGDLESLIGRLNHAAFIIPLSRHFLNRLRKRLTNKRWKKQRVTLTGYEVEDLKLWKEVFLPMASTGVSMNQMTHRRPDDIGWSDTCPFGGGGFIQDGTAWRFRVPVESPLCGCSSANNFLEFLGMAVNVMLMVRSTKRRHQCFLVLG